ncbi:MAG: DNA polymerase, partial [Thermoleophilaceae bacterium]
VLAPATLPEFRQDCNTAHGVAFDLETNSLEEYRSSSVIITMALALWGKDATDVEKIWAVPLYHSQSPFQSNWQQWFTDITDAIRCIPVRVAQNAKFDCRWTAEFGGGITATFCTLLAAHIINENRSKSLESLTREEMGLKSWKIDTTDLLAESLKKVLRYNAQDALNTGRLYFILREELRQHSDLARIFIKIMMPLSNELVHDERAGVWIDQKRHTMRWAQVRDELAEIDTKLQQWVPPDPPHPVNFNTSNFLRWWLFEHLELPVIKLTENGGPALDIGTKHYLAKAHPAVPLLIRRSSLMRGDTSFFSAYAELMDTNSRIHTTFRIAGTTTGRLSSGKGDTEKALVKPDRAINLQNVPTDPFYRSTIGAPPDRVWIEADFAQQEFRLAAMLADDPTALQAFATGQDIHRMMAAAITQHALSDVTKQERTRAKPVNFGFLYGAWEKTFIETAWKEYQLEFTMAEARRARRLFFATWSRFEAWHEQQRRFVRRHGYVVTLLGRVRRLPNIYSTVETIRWHAERQAINAPVQSLGSDLTQLAYLGIKHELRERGLERWITGLGSVHDSLLFEGDLRDGGLAKIRAALSVIKHVMENLPLRRMFGIELTVPMIAEITVGQHWGEGKELSLDEISNWEGLE